MGAADASMANIARLQVVGPRVVRGTLVFSRRFFEFFAMPKKWKSLTHVLFCACQCLWKILENHVNTDIP